MNTGCCLCRDAYRGEKCNECQLGYRDFPQCTACECSAAGSESETCDQERGVCACADRTGKCSCKANVEGHGCEDCKPGTFGLSVRNPLGCSSCYCYGLSQTCSEKQGLIRMSLMLKPEQTVLPLVDKSNSAETRTGVSFQHPEILVHADLVSSALSEPYYWRLPEQFKGSMITAYGGQLKYAVYYEAREETGSSSYEPQVIIRGGPNKDLLMMRHTAGLQIGQLTRHEIEMTEAEWKHADGRSMTREDFMDVLFYVDYILIKASQGNQMRHSRISEISLTVAEGGRPNTESERAHQIESCECPAGYSGLSCEECAAGFYRLRGAAVGPASGPASQEPAVAGMGRCVRCQCSGHSTTCDPETSICQNCQDNTEGARCESCAPGYYGVVRGFHDDCKPCACPLTNPENNFSPSCVSESSDDYRCTDCPEGYEGKYCERCATGYHGNPRMPGGRCEECKCSAWGALPGPCDPETGQCRCRGGATGLPCDQCMERHVCGPAGITSCDDDCAGLLISDMDSLYGVITSVNLTTPLPPPYKILYRFENMTEELKHMLSPQRAPERLLQLADSNLGSVVTEMDQLHNRATKVSADGEQVEDDAGRIHKGAEDLLRFIQDTLLGATELQAKAAELNATLSRRAGSPEKSLKEMKAEIQAMLAELRARQLAGKKGMAAEELGLAEELYQKVKRLFGDPHQATEDLKAEVTGKLSDHGGKLEEAQELLDAAQSKSREAGVLAAQNQANLTALEVDFLALEMRKGKVSFLWDVGSGVGRVEYPHLSINDGKWHRIEASRNGLNGTISVYPLEGALAGLLPMPASANSPTAFTILDVDHNAYLFVGGILGTVKKADAVRTTTFTGCMGETFLDSKPIGLWNYRDRQGDCKGCTVSPQASEGEGTVQLDGEGYSGVGRPVRWNPNVSTVTFKFRTFSSDALLMYLATDDMKDFMTLELSEGKIKVTFDLGSGMATATSASRHNDGRWKSLTMTRNKKKATVSIVDIDSSKEEEMDASSPGAATGLNLKEKQKIYFGGLPTQGNYRSEVTTHRYAGCLRDIEISRTPYNLLGSLDYTGVTKGCSVENIYTVSFSKPGYMELSGLSLAVATEISLSFSTQTDTGTIFLAVSGADQIDQKSAGLFSPKRKRRQSGEPYLSVMLNKGSLEVLVFTGSHNTRRVLRRADQGVLHDGREHALRIERLAGRSFAVQVDEEPKREAALPNDQPISLRRVFLGGIPAAVELSSNRANVPFQGCIWNLMVNNV
ncbi:unnamed protein product, partial [Boreogadus saida]